MRLPILPTLITALGVPAMIGLGVWQLERREWKEALLARLEARAGLPPTELATGADWRALAYRPLIVRCARWSGPPDLRAARSLDGRLGYGYRLICHTQTAPERALSVELGWLPQPAPLPAVSPPPVVRGIAVDSDARPARLPYLLVASTPPAGLKPLAPPSPDGIANNHLAYAVQWFGFAVTLAVVYALYVWRLVHRAG